MKKGIIKSCLITLLIGSSVGLIKAETRYSVTDLGTLGRDTYATSLSNKSHIAGYSWFESGDSYCRHAFAWTPSNGLLDIGTLGGKSSAGLGINGKDQITGFSNLSDQTECNPLIDNVIHAFIWSSSAGMLDLGSLGGTNSFGYGINDKGEVAGYSDIPGDQGRHAFVWSSQYGMVDLGTLGGTSSYGYGISKNGYVTGYSSTEGNGGWHAFIARSFRNHSTGKPRLPVSMRDIGTLGGDMSVGLAINDMAQVTGYSNLSEGDPDARHAFIWSERNKMIDLGTLGGSSSYGRGINNSGEVTGNSLIANPAGDMEESHGFIWTRRQGMIDLNTVIPPSSGWIITTGAGINDRGEIIAGAYKPSVGTHAVLLKPIRTCNKAPYIVIDCR